jgi:hypothetical protein
MTAQISPDRVFLGIAAAGGVIVAACLSAVPSATCAAMAETYVQAINTFGGVAALSLGIVVVLPLFAERTGKPGAYFAGGMMALIFLTCMGSGSQNLIHSVHYCLVENNSDLSSRQHKSIKIVGPSDIAGWFFVEQIGE